MMNRIAIPAVILAAALSGCDATYKTCDDLKCDAMSMECLPATAADATCQACSTGETFDAATKTCITTGAGIPNVPALGALVDRMGRPAVNTALTNPYDVYPGANPEDDLVTKERYNKDANIAGWVAAWSPAIAFHVGVLDALDTTMMQNGCGNNLLFNFGGGGGYATLAAVLADDQLYLDTSAGVCQQYLGVEAKAVGAIMGPDCGGRGLTQDVIDVTYSALAVGAFSGVTDGIANTNTFLPSFPFLGNPQ